MADHPKRGVLMALAVEGVVPVVGGCAGVLAGGPEGGVVGAAVGVAVEKVINFFGARIVERWSAWLAAQPPEVRDQALAELATLPPEEARQQAEELLDRLATEPIAAEDRSVVINYLSLLPGALDRALPREAGGGRSLPATVSLDEPQQLLSLLPVNLPPYPVGTEVPGTPYRLEALLGSGGFGAVYRASTRSLQHLPLAVKFCLDPALAAALNRERANLERLMKAGGENWSPRVVRLYGYDLEHRTPYLVYEYVTGGDLIRHLAEQRRKLGRALTAAEVFDLIAQCAEALAFAHEHGLVHRDLKPANVLVEGGVLKLADFGLGGVNAVRAAQVSRIGATTIDQLSLADQASLFRGAGTPLYMAPEQRRGMAPDPRHDLYSLGVMWYQLLVGDVSRELHPGWAKELTVRHGVPRSHLALIEACVGWFDERPRNAGELLGQMRGLREDGAAVAATPLHVRPQPAPVTAVPAAPQAETVRPADEMREALLASLVREVGEAHGRLLTPEQVMKRALAVGGGVGLLALVLSPGTGLALWLCVMFALVNGLIGFGVTYAFELHRLGAADRRLGAAVGALSKEFPEIVRGWGGEPMLRNAELFGQIQGRVRQQRADTQRPGGAVTALAVVAEKREGWRALLGEALEKARTIARLGERRPFPLVVAIPAGLLVGGLVGLWVGLTASGYLAPLPVSDGNRTTFYNVEGRTLGTSQYQLERRRMTTASVGAALVAGLLAGLPVAWLLARRSWHRKPLILGLGGGLAAGAMVGLALGFLFDGLASPYEVYEGYTRQYYNAGGTSITRERFVLFSRLVNTTSSLIGIGSGAAVALLTAWLVHRAVARRARAAKADLESLRQRAVGEFGAELPEGERLAAEVAQMERAGGEGPS